MIEVVFRLQRRDGGAKTNSRSLCAKYCSPVITRLSRDTLIILISDHLIKIESDLFFTELCLSLFSPSHLPSTVPMENLQGVKNHSKARFGWRRRMIVVKTRTAVKRVARCVEGCFRHAQPSIKLL